MPALELIDARIEQFDRDTKAPRKVLDTIADNAANAGIVLGGRPMEPDAVDWRWAGALLFKNGVIEESGLGAAVLNHPANGVAWLANKLACATTKGWPRARSCSAARSRGRSPARRATPSMPTTARSGRSPFASSDAMKTPDNSFKQALLRGDAQIGLWHGAGRSVRGRDLRQAAGFDWLLLDGEHAPNDLRSMLGACRPSRRTRCTRWCAFRMAMRR